jgi:3-hydroxyacyl-CoA dehydrogenase/enoyl-CoA hydratase/3-hydroxybutyryl-CoA epimerase/enoyl-CoA isomerase
MGKTPIVVGDCPGFLVNRILFPYFGAFSMLLRDGADYREIDAAMEAFGWPMGPAWLLDVVGIDTAVHAQAVMAEGFPDRMRYSFRSAMDLLFEAGQLGQKTGSGFYRYTADSAGRLQKQVDDEILARIRTVQGPARHFTAELIVERMMLALCLETARCLEDGIVDTAAEADMGLVLGLGFPRFRGGALRYIDSLGTRAFCALAERHAGLGPLYSPSAGLRAMAAADSRFYA